MHSFGILLAAFGMSCVLAGPAFAQSPETESIIRQQVRDGCEGAGRFVPAAIFERDLTGDGQADLILDHGGLECDGGSFGRSIQCGMRACSVYFFVRNGTELRQVSEILSIGVEIADGQPPVIRLTGHGFEEGTFRWNGATFARAGEADGPASASGSARTAGTWTYGPHPKLGLSAHIDVGDGAVGLACGFEGTNLLRTDPLALRLTNGLLDGPELTFMFVGAEDSGGTTLTPQGEFMELAGSTCSGSLSAFQSASEFLIIDGRVSSVTSEGGGTMTTIEQDGKAVTVSSGAEAKAKLRTRAISLRGSSKSISRLIAACPAIRQDIDNDCGI